MVGSDVHQKRKAGDVARRRLPLRVFLLSVIALRDAARPLKYGVRAEVRRQVRTSGALAQRRGTLLRIGRPRVDVRRVTDNRPALRPPAEGCELQIRRGTANVLTGSAHFGRMRTAEQRQCDHSGLQEPSAFTGIRVCVIHGI